MRFSEKVAFLVTERRGLIVERGSADRDLQCWHFWWHFWLDTEVPNLLPRGFDSVEGLKIYNREFAQTCAN